MYIYIYIHTYIFIQYLCACFPGLSKLTRPQKPVDSGAWPRNNMNSLISRYIIEKWERACARSPG